VTRRANRLREVTLDEQDIEAIAVRVADILNESRREMRPVRLLSASEVATALGVSRAWVYHHAAALGGVRLGESGGGRRASLRFDLDRVRRSLEGSREPDASAAAAGRSRGRSSRKSPPAAELIEYDGAA